MEQRHKYLHHSPSGSFPPFTRKATLGGLDKKDMFIMFCQTIGGALAFFFVYYGFEKSLFFDEETQVIIMLAIPYVLIGIFLYWLTKNQIKINRRIAILEKING